MKKIVVAVDSFKGCLTSKQVGIAVEEGIKKVFPFCEVVLLPVADGGEGLLDVLTSVIGGRQIALRAHDPLMDKIETRYIISEDGKKALIEMAVINGLPLVPVEKRNPMMATSFGTGELIRDALERGCRDFIIGIGGSATNDAGLGMLQALGFRFLDKQGEPLGTGGCVMAHVAAVDRSYIHPGLKEARFTIACDVHNPFCGPEGAAYMYAPQKGADEEMVKKLDLGMQSLSQIMYQVSGKDISHCPGAGAAGGMGGGFLAFLNAQLKPGIHLLLDMLGFADKIADADLVITGEGKVDRQTCMGKVPFGILYEAQKLHIPVIGIAGSIEDVDKLNQAGFQGIFSIAPGPVALKESMDPDFAKQNIKRLITQICQTIQAI